MSFDPDILLLSIMVAAGLWAAMTRSLLRAAVALALTSAVVAVYMFRLDSPLAAIFELSVCSGLISVLFISTISITLPESRAEKTAHGRQRMSRFRFLPPLVIVAGILLSLLSPSLSGPLPGPMAQPDIRVMLWEIRPVDMIGQVIVLLAGAFGVVILFKERVKK